MRFNHNLQVSILGDTQFKFTDNFANIVNLMVMSNNRYLFTKEQEKFFREFLVEAEKVTAGQIGVDEMTNKMQQFNTFLGTYEGVEEDE